MYCIIKCIVQGKQARVKNADLPHPSCTVVIEKRKSASPVLNVLIRRLQIAWALQIQLFLILKQIWSLQTVRHWTVSRTTQRLCLCMNHSSSNKGRRYSTVGLVNRLLVAKQSNFGSIPSEDSPFTWSMQLGYWAIQLTIQREWVIKRPGLKTENQQRSSTKNKDERYINPLIVHLQVIYSTIGLEQMLFTKKFLACCEKHAELSNSA